VKLLGWNRNTSYRVPVALGDVVEDVSCLHCTPRPVRVVHLFSWGLRVAPLYRLAGESDYDCTRWRLIEEE
jgi:hypothetical protein